MGNALCLQPSSRSSTVKLIFWPEGTTRILTGKKRHIAGEIMFENPTMMVCHADSFFIGHTIPSLGIQDRLVPSQTYFVLPIDRFACHVLSAASLSTVFSPSPVRSPLNLGGECPFQYLKGDNGRGLIKVTPEFIMKMINKDREENGPGNYFLCSTPELKKHYELLVGSKEQPWSPKLETISEHKIRYSPCRYIGLEWKQKERITHRSMTN